MSEWQTIDTAPTGVLLLLVWRPVDYKERPFHREVITGSLSFYQEGQVWANGRLYDIKTHITHWMPLPELPELINTHTS